MKRIDLQVSLGGSPAPRVPYEKPMVLAECHLESLPLLGTLSYLEVEVDDLEDLGEAP